MPPAKPRPYVYLIYRKLKGTYHESPWVLYRRAWTYTRPAAEDLASRINEWDVAFIGSQSTVQVRKFYYDEPSKKQLKKYWKSSTSYNTGSGQRKFKRPDRLSENKKSKESK